MLLDIVLRTPTSCFLIRRLTTAGSKRVHGPRPLPPSATHPLRLLQQELLGPRPSRKPHLCASFSHFRLLQELDCYAQHSGSEWWPPFFLRRRSAVREVLAAPSHRLVFALADSGVCTVFDQGSCTFAGVGWASVVLAQGAWLSSPLAACHQSLCACGCRLWPPALLPEPGGRRDCAHAVPQPPGTSPLPHHHQHLWQRCAPRGWSRTGLVLHRSTSLPLPPPATRD